MILQLSAILVFEYWQRIEAPNEERRYILHNAILNGEAPYQYRYRILIPIAADTLAHVIQHFELANNPSKGSEHYSRRAFNTAYVILNWIAFAGFLAFLYLIIRQWWEPVYGLFGIVFSTVIIFLTFRDHYFHPWSFWEAMLIVFGMWLVLQKRYWLLLPLMIVGALVRETSVYLPLGFLIYAFPTPPTLRSLRTGKILRFAVGGLLLWVVAYAIVHLVVGYRPSTFFVATAIAGNFRNATYAAGINFLVIGPIFVFICKGIFRSNRFLQSFALALVPYMMLLGVIGYWWEVRYWLPALPVLVNCLLVGAFGMVNPSAVNQELAAHRQ